MNTYQHKRIEGCLKPYLRLSPSERAFLEHIRGRKVVHWGERDTQPLTRDENHLLNRIAQRVGG